MLLESINETEKQSRHKQASLEEELENKRTIEDYGKQIASMNIMLDKTISELREDNNELSDTIRRLERQYSSKCSEYEELEKLNLELRDVAKEQGDLRISYEKDLKMVQNRSGIWDEEKRELLMKLEEVKRERLALLETGEKLRNEIVILTMELKNNTQHEHHSNRLEHEDLVMLRRGNHQKDEVIGQLREDIRYKGLEMMRLSKEIARVMEERDELVKSKLLRSSNNSPGRGEGSLRGSSHKGAHPDSDRGLVYKLQDEREFLLNRLNDFKDDRSRLEEASKNLDVCSGQLDKEREMSQNLY